MSLVLYVRLPLILAAKLVGLFFTIALKKKKKKKKKKGKTYLIHCIRLLLGDRVRVATPTGVAAYNIDGHTLHSLLHLPTKGEFEDLEGERLHHMQQSLARMRYLVIDEMSMVGRKIFGQIDKRLR